MTLKKMLYNQMICPSFRFDLFIVLLVFCCRYPWFGIQQKRFVHPYFPMVFFIFILFPFYYFIIIIFIITIIINTIIINYSHYYNYFFIFFYFFNYFIYYYNDVFRIKR